MEKSGEDKSLVDRFGRIHDYLRISLTERCNLRCFYCMPEDGIELRERSEFMTHEELISIAKSFVELGVKKIRLTGGEPLIKKDVSMLIEALGGLPVELAITTNGVLVDRFIETFKKAGIKDVNVSLDSIKEERFNSISRRSYFQEIMQNIDLLVEHDFNVKVNVVVIKGVNEDEIVDFVEWTRNRKLNVRFIEFMPFDGNQWDWKKKVSYNEMIQLIDEHFGENSYRKLGDAPNDTSKNFQFINGVGSFGIISSITNPFCDTCNRIRLTADGKIKNCLFSGDEIDLLTAYRNNEPIVGLIQQSIHAKHKERAGLPAFSDEEIKKHKNRSMIAIGG